MVKSKKAPILHNDIANDSVYLQVLTDIKRDIQAAQMRATLAVNTELIKLYWGLGKRIHEKQQENVHWGTSMIEQLAKDLQSAFPGVGGFSKTSLFSMRSFYLAYEHQIGNLEIFQQAVGKFEDLPVFNIPWGHNIAIITKLKETTERLWYAQKAIDHGWSRSILEMQIKSDLYNRQGKAITNFSRTLPAPQSDMAQQSFKDPYIFDFLTLRDKYNEREVEQGLIDHIQRFLLELGQGFAFVGRQYHLTVAEKDYYLDLLFYHLKLRCYIVIELKSTEFQPEFAGKLNFYLSAVDDALKAPQDAPTIGLLLCNSKENLTVEYALRNISSPIGIAQYEAKLVESLPKNLKGSLPSVEEIEAELLKKTQ